MKSQAKLYGPIHKGLVCIAYASNEGSNEAVHSHSLARAFPALNKKNGIQLKPQANFMGMCLTLRYLFFL